MGDKDPQSQSLAPEKPKTFSEQKPAKRPWPNSAEELSRMLGCPVTVEDFSQNGSSSIVIVGGQNSAKSDEK